MYSDLYFDLNYNVPAYEKMYIERKFVRNCTVLKL